MGKEPWKRGAGARKRRMWRRGLQLSQSVRTVMEDDLCAGTTDMLDGCCWSVRQVDTMKIHPGMGRRYICMLSPSKCCLLRLPCRRKRSNHASVVA